MLEFEVNGQKLLLNRHELYVAADSIDYLKARFSFSADWDGVIKTAIFKTADRNEVYHVILDENGICTVPSEVIHTPMFHVSVFGGNRITANEVQVICDMSGYAEGGAPDEPTPDVYSQIIDLLNTISSGGGGGIVVETDPTVPDWAKQANPPEADTITNTEILEIMGEM